MANQGAGDKFCVGGKFVKIENDGARAVYSHWKFQPTLVLGTVTSSTGSGKHTWILSFEHKAGETGAPSACVGVTNGFNEKLDSKFLNQQLTESTYYATWNGDSKYIWRFQLLHTTFVSHFFYFFFSSFFFLWKVFFFLL